MNRGNQIALGISILISLVLIFSGSMIRVVPVGHVGVVFNLFGGVEKRILHEGVNILFPIIETATVYDIKKTSYSFTDSPELGNVGPRIQCQTNDGQQVDIDVTIIAHLNKNTVWKLHQDLGRDYVDKLIIPQTRSIIRNIIAKYPIDTVYTSARAGLSNDAARSLKKSFSKSGVTLDELLIRRIIFSQAFAEAVEKKQIALQESQRQNWIKKTAEREKERRIIEGEGDARALEVKGRALQLDPKIAELEFLEQLDQRGAEIPVITGTKNAILSIGELFKETEKQGNKEAGKE